MDERIRKELRKAKILPQQERRGIVLVYTGEGAGKTSAALGRALRAVGHGQMVVIIQFLKGRTGIGEYMVHPRLSPHYEIRQFGSPEFIDLRNPSAGDIRKAEEGLAFAWEALRRVPAPDLLVLDEINYACHFKLLQTERVLELMREKPKHTTVILTGRNAPQGFIDLATIASEIVDLKPREDFAYTAQAGIDF